MMDDNQDYSDMTLREILDNEDLVLEEVLAIPGIHNKIKLNMKVFTQFCCSHPAFTHKFINIGLKCPMHESNNQSMKNMTYIAADVLTNDHESLADLFILKNGHKEDPTEGQIEEEIETQESSGLQPQERYVFLLSLFQYLNSGELDENCVNYISKSLATLIRKKISHFLQFFIERPQNLARLVHLSYFPSISHLLAKMLTDDDDNITPRAMSVKEKIIPLLLNKIHQCISKPQTAELFQGMEDILNASRYADSEEKTPLQRMSEVMVGEKEVQFFVKGYLDSLSGGKKDGESLNCLQNCSTYLTILLLRMNMDEQQDFTYNNQPAEFTPTLTYQLDHLFTSFCKMASNFHHIWGFKEVAGPMFPLLSAKSLEPLILMTKHSKFCDYYQKINKAERLLALQSLLRLFCTANLNGVLLQSISSLFEKMLTQQQKLSTSEQQIVCPGDLYIAIAQFAGAIGGGITMLLQQKRNSRNRNEKGIYFRKILLLLDNYFKHEAVTKKYPDTAKLQKLFPPFNAHNNHLYTQKTIALDHPGGNNAQPVEEFKFLEKNREIMRSESPELEATYPGTSPKAEKKESQVSQPEEKPADREEKTKEITFKLTDKINDRKNRVKLKRQIQSNASSQSGESRPHTPFKSEPAPSFEQQSFAEQPKVEVRSPRKSPGKSSSKPVQVEGAKRPDVLHSAPRDLLIQQK